MKDDSPAFPDTGNSPAFPTTSEPFHQGLCGLSAREYAAIHLRQPDSGVEWLDAMIRKAKRDEIAMRAIVPTAERTNLDDVMDVAEHAYALADAMLAEAEKV